MSCFSQSAWTSLYNFSGQANICQVSELTFTLCPFLGRMNEHQWPAGLRASAWCLAPRDVSWLTFWRMSNPKKNGIQKKTQNWAPCFQRLYHIGHLSQTCFNHSPWALSCNILKWNARTVWINPSSSWKSPLTPGSADNPFVVYPGNIHQWGS